MIAKKIAKRSLSNFGKLADYLAAASDKGEKLDDLWVVNCKAGDGPEVLREAKDEIALTQELNSRCRSDKTYHLLLSFRDEKPSPDALREIEAEFAKALGFGDHQRIAATHANTDNFHMHVAINRIHPETHLLHSPSHDYRAMSKVCRAMEQKHGLKIDRGMEGRTDQSKVHSKAADFEAHRWEQSFLSYAREHKPALDAARQAANSWQDLHAAFHAQGLVLKASGAGLVVRAVPDKDQAKTGNKPQSIKASDLGRNYSKAALEAEFGTFEPARDQLRRPAQIYKRRPAPSRAVISPRIARMFRRYAAIPKKRNFESMKKFLFDVMIFDAETALWLKAQRDVNSLPFELLKVFAMGGGPKPFLPPTPLRLPEEPPDLTTAFLTQMETNTAPWQQDQPAIGNPLKAQAVPYNPASSKAFEGMNALWLAKTGRTDPRWLTAKQLRELGTAPKRGERPTYIEHWSFQSRQVAKDKDGKVIIGKTGKPVIRRVHLDQPKITRVAVYNAQQVKRPDKLPDHEPIDPQNNRANARARRLLKSSGIELRRDQQSASFHDPVSDTLHLRSTKCFDKMASYHAEAIRTLCAAVDDRQTKRNHSEARTQADEAIVLTDLRRDIAAHMVCTQLGLKSAAPKAESHELIKTLKADERRLHDVCREAETISRAVMDCEGKEARTFLNVPLTQAKAARAKGAKFDMIERAFYVPEGAGANNFKKWLRDDPAKRTPLQVPHRDRKAASTLGARWDRNTKHWYIPGHNSFNPEPFNKWLQKQPVKEQEPAKAQTAAEQKAQTPKPAIQQGKLER